MSGGFNLTEVVITLTVLGILAGASVPLYHGHVESMRAQEARAALMLIHSAEMSFRTSGSGAGEMQPDLYWPSPSATVSDISAINAAMGLNLVENYYDFAITTSTCGPPGECFEASATRVGGDKVYWITQGGTINEDYDE